MKALLVVDMQNDFIDGTLPVPGAREIIVPIQNYIRDLLLSKHSGFIAFTGCAHPPNHKSFKEQGGQWPAHCVRGTLGSDLQFGLQMIQRSYQMPVYWKGTHPDQEEYSGFANERLNIVLQAAMVTEVEVCGLARNYCVEATAQAAREHGYVVTVLEELCRAV